MFIFCGIRIFMQTSSFNEMPCKPFWQASLKKKKKKKKSKAKEKNRILHQLFVFEFAFMFLDSSFVHYYTAFLNRRIRGQWHIGYEKADMPFLSCGERIALTGYRVYIQLVKSQHASHWAWFRLYAVTEEDMRINTEYSVEYSCIYCFLAKDHFCFQWQFRYLIFRECFSFKCLYRIV